MTQYEEWPPPDWTEVVVSWDIMLTNSDYVPNLLTEWCDHHDSVGRWHLHGWKKTEGFAFRFEDPKDAVMFKLKWSQG